MRKDEFLLTMQNALSGMHRADLERTLQYYREMIEDRMEEGMDEAHAVADVGDPIELAEAIRGKPVKRTAVSTPKPPRQPKERKPMSGGKKAALIAAACLLVVAGVGLILASLNLGGSSMTDKEYTFANAPIHSLDIESGSAEVKLLPASDGICRVVCTEDAGHSYKVLLDSGTLHVESVSKWRLFPVSLSENRVWLYLPEREYESLWLKSSSGGVSVPANFRFGYAVVDVSSGSVVFGAAVTEELNLQSSSGGVAVSGTSPKSMFVSCSSGGVFLGSMSPDSVQLSLSSGSLHVDGVRCGELFAKSSSGSVRFNDVIAKGKLTLDCTSGSIKLDDCDAAELYIENTSGSVSGHLLTDKVYDLRTTSGSVSAPESVSGAGICTVRTTSGSIRFE